MHCAISRCGVRRAPRRSAFTLIELLLVMVILTILAGLTVMRFAGIREKANISAAKTEISTLKTALSRYELDNGHFPSSAEGGLQALVANPGLAGWNTGGYLEKPVVPKDPWQRDYVYQCPGASNTDYDLYSTGSDGQQHIEP